MPSDLEKFSVTLEKIYYDIRDKLSKLGLSQNDFFEMSKEEVYKLIPWKFIKIPVAGDLGKGDGSWGESLEGVEGEGEELQEGYKDLYEGDDEEREQRWKEAIADAYSAQKLAGRVPGNLKRLVDRLLSPQVDWRSLLRQALITGLGKTVVSSWRRPSRKGKISPVKTSDVSWDSTLHDSYSLAFN